MGVESRVQGESTATMKRNVVKVKEKGLYKGEGRDADHDNSILTANATCCTRFMSNTLRTSWSKGYPEWYKAQPFFELFLPTISADLGGSQRSRKHVAAVESSRSLGRTTEKEQPNSPNYIT